MPSQSVSVLEEFNAVSDWILYHLLPAESVTVSKITTAKLYVRGLVTPFVFCPKVWMTGDE